MIELARPLGFTDEERREFLDVSNQRRWGVSIALVGVLHLIAFLTCHYLTNVQNYHGSLGYLGIWVSELLTMWAIFRLVGGRRTQPIGPPEKLVRRIWIAYFVLAFNLGSLNTLRGHFYFEFFPAIASLASFAFIMMSVLVHPRFFWAVVVTFSSGLLMAANFLHAYLIFAIAWFVVLEGIAWNLRNATISTPSRG